MKSHEDAILEEGVTTPTPVTSQGSSEQLKSDGTNAFMKQSPNPSVRSGSFKCSKCPLTTFDRSTLLNHSCGFHGVFDQYLRDNHRDMSEEKNDDHKLTEDVITGTFDQNLLAGPQGQTFEASMLDGIQDGTAAGNKLLKCNQSGCQFGTFNIGSLLSHLESQHKFLIRYCGNPAGVEAEPKKQIQNGNCYNSQSGQVASSSAQFANTGPISSSSTPVPHPVPKNTSKSQQTCPVCSKKMNSDELMIHLANQHLSEVLAQDGVPTEPPFGCPLCPHFSPSQVSILQHWLVFHNMLKKYISQDSETSSLNHEKGRQYLASANSTPVNLETKEYSEFSVSAQLASNLFSDDSFSGSLAPHDSRDIMSQILGEKSSSKKSFDQGNLTPETIANVLFGGDEQKANFSDSVPVSSVASSNTQVSGQCTSSSSSKSQVRYFQDKRNQVSRKMECLMCDDVRVVGSTPLDLHKHLTEKHFRDRLMALIPSIVNTVDGKPRFCCPYLGCYYEHHYKWIIAKHYGIKHRKAKEFYDEVIGVSNQVQQETTTRQNKQSGGPNSNKSVSSSAKTSNAFNKKDSKSSEKGKSVKTNQKQAGGGAPKLKRNQYFSYKSQVKKEEANSLVQPKSGVYNFNTESEDESSQVSFSDDVDFTEDSDLSDEIDLDDDEEDPFKMKQYFAGGNDKIKSNGQQSQINFNCKLCSEKLETIPKYLKHLSKAHFKHKLLSYVSKTAPFNCPWLDCNVSKRGRLNTALHFGVSHRVAFKLLQEMPNAASIDEPNPTCKLCQRLFQTEIDLWTHLADDHYSKQIDVCLPRFYPWKCPRCSFEGADQRALRIHFGVTHRVVLEYLASDVESNKNSHAAKSELKYDNSDMFFEALSYNSGFNKNSSSNFKEMIPSELLESQQFQCPKCDFNGSSQIELVLHFDSSHPDSSEPDFSSQPGQDLGGQVHHVDPPNPCRVDEDEKFPKCQICDYRYFTRLDLCRHFVDYHLRRRIENCIDPNSHQCPSCFLTYEKQQSCLRHFIWSHQDLEYLVMQDFRVRLSEFMPSTKDLEIVKMKTERMINGTGANDMKCLTDLAALPVHDVINLKENVSSCELCGEEFTKSVNMVRDKSAHLLGHFKEYLLKDLPNCQPFKCPNCPFIGKELSSLCEHYGFLHNVVFKLMQSELGENWSIDKMNESKNYDSRIFYHSVSFKSSPANHNMTPTTSSSSGSEYKMVPPSAADRKQANGSTNVVNTHAAQQRKRPHSEVGKSDESKTQSPIQCPICQTFFSNSMQFLKHLTDQHFQDQLATDLQTLDCPLCHFQGKDKKILIWHYGISHKKVLNLLSEWAKKNNFQDEELLSKLSKKEMKPESCPLCESSFGGPYMLLRHLADCHFRDKLSNGFLDGDTYKCPECSHSSKDKGGFVRHLGLVHKRVQKCLLAMGIMKFQEDSETKKPNQKVVKSESASPFPSFETKDSLPEIKEEKDPYELELASAFNSNHQQTQYYNTHQKSNVYMSSSSGFESSGYIVPKSEPAKQPFNYSSDPIQHFSDDFRDGSSYLQDHLFSPTNFDFSPIQQELSQLKSVENDQKSHIQSFSPGISFDNLTRRPDLTDSQNLDSAQHSSQTSLYNSSTSNSPASTNNDYKMFNPLPYLEPKNQNLYLYIKGEKQQLTEQEAAKQNSYFVIQYPTNSTCQTAPPPSYQSGMSQSPSLTNDSFKDSPSSSGGPVKIQCSYCKNNYSSKNEFLNHLLEQHLQKDLFEDLPKNPPFKCPITGCLFEDDSLASLVEHYGISHRTLKKQAYAESQLRSSTSNSNVNTTPSLSATEAHAEPVPPIQIPRVVLKLICPLCSVLYGSHLDFYQHLCDNHFKENLIKEVNKTSPTFECGMAGCNFNANGSSQNLIYHIGIAHKMVFDLLKAYLSDNPSVYLMPGNQVGEDKKSVVTSELQYPNSVDQFSLSRSSAESQPEQHLPIQPDPNKLFCSDDFRDTQNKSVEPKLSVTLNPADTKTLPVASEGLDSNFLDFHGSPNGIGLKGATRDSEEIANEKIEQVKRNPKECEVCGKVFEGKNRAMLKVQHLAHHFKDQLFANLKDKSPPFRCPISACTYQTKHKPDWARHYGSVHQFISKYLNEYLEQSQNHNKDSSGLTGDQWKPTPDSSENNFRISDGERTYSAFLPKDDLNQIISTAISQQSQTGKNFGVVTINPVPVSEDESSLSFVEQVIRHSTKIDATGLVSQPSPLPDFNGHNCLICYAWFPNEDDLNDHMSQHLQLANQTFLQPDVATQSEKQQPDPTLPKVETSFNANPTPGTSSSVQHAKSSTKLTSGTIVPNRSTGRPCEICGFEPKTKNKSRERQDHLAMKHYRDRIQGDLASTNCYRCPLCDYNGKDKQTIYRHYTGKHKVVEQYLADDIASGKIIPLALQQQQQQQQHFQLPDQQQQQDQKLQQLVQPSLQVSPLQPVNGSQVVAPLTNNKIQHSAESTQMHHHHHQHLHHQQNVLLSDQQDGGPLSHHNVHDTDMNQIHRLHQQDVLLSDQNQLQQLSNHHSHDSDDTDKLLGQQKSHSSSLGLPLLDNFDFCSPGLSDSHFGLGIHSPVATRLSSLMDIPESDDHLMEVENPSLEADDMLL